MIFRKHKLGAVRGTMKTTHVMQMHIRRWFAAVAGVSLLVGVLVGCTRMVAPDLTFSTAEPTIAVPTLVQGEAMVAVTLPAASGGSGDATYTLTPDVPGLKFNGATRVLSGTPTAAGTYAMTYTATDDDTEMVTLGFTIAVVDRLSFDVRTIESVSVIVGAAIEPLVLPKAVGGTGELAYTLEPDVPGLTFDGATRTLSGTPTRAGTYAMTYTATDAAGTSVMLGFDFTVEVPGIRGTWRTTNDWWERDEETDEHRKVGYWVDTLTFTKERYIVHRAHFNNQGTWIYDDWNSGTWELDEEAGIVIHIYDDNVWDDDDVDTVRRQRYRWGNEVRTVLFLEGRRDAWYTQPFEPWHRVEGPPYPPTGVWVWEHPNGQWKFILRLSADGSYHLTGDHAVGSHEDFGRWTLDDEDNYYLIVVEDDVGRERRMAYAPTDRADKLAFSLLWDEDPQHRNYARYGNYHRIFERQ